MSHGYDTRRNAPNEDSEMWREYHKDQSEARTRRKEANLAILRASVIPFVYRNNNDVVMVRLPGYPKVDFWTTANHWKTGNRDMKGDANALIDWLKRRVMR